MQNKLIFTTLCYIEQDGKYLMLHRNKKKDDINKNKYIGIGGHLEHGETPEECIVRETLEETGLKLENPVLRGMITFVMDEVTEHSFLYTCDAFSGSIHVCTEGELVWIEKDKVLEFIDTYRKIYDFAEIIPTSALRGQNVEDVIDSIFKYLPYGPQFYDEDTITDQPERAICAEIIREKALHALNDEVPHGIAVAIDQMKERKGGNMFDIDATIVCERDSHKGIIIGKQVAMLKKIGTNARYEMERLLDAKVNLKLWVKVKKDWRDSDFLIKNFGYHDDDH